MMNEKHKLLLKKREICKPDLTVTSNDLARALKAKLKAGDPDWKYLGGYVPGHGWSQREELIDLETVIYEDDPKTSYRRDLFFTFARCIDIDLVTDYYHASGIEFVRIKIHDGGRVDPRAVLYLDGPWWTIKDFQDLIERRWALYTMKQVDAEEQNRLERRRIEIAEGILAGTYAVNKEGD